MDNKLDFIVKIFERKDKDGEISNQFRGTGVFIDGRNILTCKHVTQAMDRFQNYIEGEPCNLTINVMDGQPITIEKEDVVWDNRGYDLALLKLADEVKVAPLKIVENITASVLEMLPFQAHGYAQSSYKTGQVKYDLRGKKDRIHPSQQSSNTGHVTSITIDCGLESGLSGSPLLTEFDGGWAYLGTADLGGRDSGTSSAVMADVVIQFLEANVLNGKIFKIDAKKVIPPSIQEEEISTIFKTVIEKNNGRVINIGKVIGDLKIS